MLTYLDNILLTEGHLHKQRVADVAGVHQLHYVLRQCLARLLTATVSLVSYQLLLSYQPYRQHTVGWSTGGTSSATSGVDFNRQ